MSGLSPVERYGKGYKKILSPLLSLAGRMKLSPNHFSFAGLVFSVSGGVAYAAGALWGGGMLVLGAGLCDSLDGELARRSGAASRFGAFLDSILDRYGEFFLFAGLAWHYAGDALVQETGAPGRSNPVAVLLIFFAASGSFMVSYARARAEGLEIACRAGLLQRPERLIILVAGSFLSALPAVGGIAMPAALLSIAILSHWTALQRILHVYTAERGNE